MTYNGWTNYETWLCNLWLDGLEFDDYIQDLSDDHESKDSVLDWVADYLEEYVQEIIDCSLNPGDTHGFIADLINSAFQEIDFRDIAEHYVDDIWDDIETYRQEQEDALAPV